MDFIALDVELANTNIYSICQIGLVRYEQGQLVEEFSTLVDPQEPFFGMGIRKHNIDETMVRGKPKFPELAQHLNKTLWGQVCISHGGLDRSAILKLCDIWELEKPSCEWLNLQTVVRRVWPQFAEKGYGLENVAAHLGIQYQAHDALEDAKAAAQIMLTAMHMSGKNALEWCDELKRQSVPSEHVVHVADWRKHITAAGNPDGPYYGKEIVFTGLLKETEAQFASVAQELGFSIWKGIRKKTITHLCHSDELPQSTLNAGREFTSKHETAIELRKNGMDIEILSETEFKQRFIVSQ